MTTLRFSNLCLIVLSLLIVSGCGGGSGSTGVSSTTSNSTNNTANTLAIPRTTALPPPPTLAATPANLPSFMAFESGQVRPLAISPVGDTLYAVNTPNNALEVFAISKDQLTHQTSVPVGMEPVAVAVHGNEVWVVNHLSDSVSIIDMSLSPARVVKTLLVGDEPRDIVFAGPSRHRAFVTTAHRGQNSPVDPQLTTPGVARADVWVFDSQNLGQSMGGTPLKIISLFGDTPRALATSTDGSKVYAAIFNSGNKTTAIHQVATQTKGPPMDNIQGIEAPMTGHILQFREGRWQDEQGTIFNQARLNLPDLDLFTIDAMVDDPVEINRVSGVGTTLFNLAVHPINEKVFVSNTNSRNHVRFEGMGDRGTTVRQHFVENRITIVNGNDVSIRQLNKHINPEQLSTSAPDKAASVSMPLGMAFSANGKRLYVAAMGSNKISVLDVDSLDNNQFDPRQQISIALTGGGPTGVVLDEQNQQAYALTRFDNGISMIDLQNNTEMAHQQLFNPEPASVINGRPFLYDADLTSSNGTSSCGGCHIFGDTDHLSWDLGNPDEVQKPDPHPVVPFSKPITGPFLQRRASYHPMKGPKGTQSMRGLANHGPMHWRGDRTGLNRVNGESQEEASFKEFNLAFEGLVGRAEQLNDQQMQQFTDFAMQLSYPPNPHRPLNNQLTGDLAEGHRVYTDLATSGDFNTRDNTNLGCNSCHILQPENGRYGSAANMVAVLGNNDQDFKVPHFRNLYQKVGFFRAGLTVPQVRGFGFSQNGATANLMDLLNVTSFTFETPRQSLQLAKFMFAYDTLLAPIVGQQVTLPNDNQTDALTRVDLLFERAQVTGLVPECDLIVKGVWGGEQRGAVMQDSGVFQTDKAAQTHTLAELKALALGIGNHLSFMCVPPNSGIRMGVDRDLDGVLDGE
jgi:DNA-binding beta-propeller fold protein YncE